MISLEQAGYTQASTHAELQNKRKEHASPDCAPLLQLQRTGFGIVFSATKATMLELAHLNRTCRAFWNNVFATATGIGFWNTSVYRDRQQASRLLFVKASS
jgi:hypothetical protein